jgi:hypothetical protein
MVAYPNIRPRHTGVFNRFASTVVALATVVTAVACGTTATTNVGPSPVRCELSLSSSPNPVPAAGGPVTVAVAADPECEWTATENSTWITQMVPASGQGSAQITLTTTANNTLSARQDMVTVNGVNQVIRQESGTCTPQLSSLSTTVTPAAQSVSVQVSLITGCTWTAVSNAAFVTVASGASGNGNGTVNLNIAANTAAPSRQGTVTIAGQTFTVTQGGVACTYSVTPTSQSFPFQGGNGSSTVTSPDGCAWTATSSSPFIAITAGGTGSGNGSVAFSVAANPTLADRQGTLTIAGQTFTVSQAALTCSYTITPATFSVGAGGGSGSTNVTTPPVCGWTIFSTEPWLTFSGGASRIGSGTVNFTVAANPAGVSREAVLSIEGQSFTVTQEGAPCQYSISPSSQTIGSGGGPGAPVNVSATPGCDWIAESNDSFITVTNGSGTGNGIATFSVAANTSVNQRQGTLTIAGQTFTVTQQGITCSFSISPASQNVAAGGGNGSTNVTAPAGCAWTAASNIGFITVTGGSSGNGNGQVTFSVAANGTLSTRQGTLTIAGQTFTVTQAAATCTYSIAPTSLNAPAGASTGSFNVTSSLSACTWTAAPGPSSSFITITGPAGGNGSGNGPVSFSVAANTGPARSGTIVVAGQTFTVNQASGCTVTFTPTSQNVPVGGGTASTNVTAGVGCTWSAVTGPGSGFITITSPAMGAGNGSATATFSVAANSGAARTGTVLIAGNPFTINQAGCTYSIAPTSRTHPNSLVVTSATVTVTAPASCSWTAVSNAAFLTVTGGATGMGNGTVTYSVAPQALGTRTGTLTIAGQTFTVTQGP